MKITTFSGPHGKYEVSTRNRRVIVHKVVGMSTEVVCEYDHPRRRYMAEMKAKVMAEKGGKW